MEISIQSDISEVMSEFQDIYAKSIPYAISGAINDTLFNSRQRLSDEEKSVFDKPTVFTTQLKSWEIDKATAEYSVGTIKLKKAQADYLIWQVFGGTRTPKKRAIGIPQEGGDLLAWHGGLVKDWKKVLKDEVKYKYFSGIPKNHPNARPGIYKRIGAKNKKGQRAGFALKMELAWEESADYPKLLFQFEQVITAYVRQNFRDNFRKRLEASRLYQRTH